MWQVKILKFKLSSMLRQNSSYFSLTLQTCCILVPCPPSSVNILSWGKAGTSSSGQELLAFSVVWCSLRCSLYHLLFGHYTIMASSHSPMSSVPLRHQTTTPHTLCTLHPNWWPLRIQWLSSLSPFLTLPGAKPTSFYVCRKSPRPEKVLFCFHFSSRVVLYHAAWTVFLYHILKNLLSGPEPRFRVLKETLPSKLWTLLQFRTCT